MTVQLAWGNLDLFHGGYLELKGGNYMVVPVSLAEVSLSVRYNIYTVYLCNVVYTAKTIWPLRVNLYTLKGSLTNKICLKSKTPYLPSINKT